MSEDYKIQVSLKFGAYDEQMLNVRADSTSELENIVMGLKIESLVELGAHLKAASVVATPQNTPAASDTATTQQQTTAGAVNVPTPNPDAPPANEMRCKHGTRTKRSGNGATGPWTGYFCRLAKGHPDQCPVVWED